MHWTYKTKPDLTQFGFVYCITNLNTNKAYIGCKQYFNYKKGKFEIIAEFKNKRSLRYYECYYQMKYNVLTATLEDTTLPAFYNNYVGGKFYRPVEEHVSL